MKRLYVTGTDTGVGKTRVSAALALAAVAHSGDSVTIVKLVQTGVGPYDRGDAAEAAAFAGCAARELRRYEAAADPWSAALAEGRDPATAAGLAAEIGSLSGTAVVEGSGGAAVPLNACESLSDAARAAHCEAILVVGLRLGCINHALLTLAYLSARAMLVRAVVFCEAFGPTSDGYRAQVQRGLGTQVPVAACVAYDPEPARSIAAAALAFSPLWRSETAR